MPKHVRLQAKETQAGCECLTASRAHGSITHAVTRSRAKKKLHEGGLTWTRIPYCCFAYFKGGLTGGSPYALYNSYSYCTVGTRTRDCETVQPCGGS